MRQTNEEDQLAKTRQKTRADPTYMDESLWGALPIEVLDRILASLPFPFLFRIRCVCKRWRTLLADPEFLKARAELLAPWNVSLYPAVCFLSDRNYRDGFWWAAFDFSRDKWQIMPSLPQNFCGKHELYGSGGGLFCLQASKSLADMKVLSVCNPITAQWRDLPPLLHSWGDPVIRHMIMDFSTSSYKIILAGNRNYEVKDEEYQITEVYDSTLQTWKKGAKFLPSLYLPSPLGAYCNGFLFFLASRPMSYVYDVLIGYDVEQDVWMEIPHVPPKGIHGIPHLFERKGNLWMMISHLRMGGVAAYAFFELNLNTKMWTPKLRMPPDISQTFAYIGSCAASGNRLCVTGGTPYKEPVVAVYDRSQRAWQWLPTCPLKASSLGDRVEFAFQPNVHATP
jgi:hypothetical protein